MRMNLLTLSWHLASEIRITMRLYRIFLRPELTVYTSFPFVSVWGKQNQFQFTHSVRPFDWFLFDCWVVCWRNSASNTLHHHYSRCFGFQFFIFPDFFFLFSRIRATFARNGYESFQRIGSTTFGHSWQPQQLMLKRAYCHRAAPVNQT